MPKKPGGQPRLRRVRQPLSLSALRVGEQWGEGRGEVRVHFQARNEPLTNPVHGEVLSTYRRHERL